MPTSTNGIKCPYGYKLDSALEHEECMSWISKAPNDASCKHILDCIDKFWENYEVTKPIGFKGLLKYRRFQPRTEYYKKKLVASLL
jgi:hypothetical protein